MQAVWEREEVSREGVGREMGMLKKYALCLHRHTYAHTHTG